MDGKAITEMLTNLSEACQVIQDKDMCGDCPIKNNCFCVRGVTVWDICMDTNAKSFDDFLKLADYAEYYISDEDREALYADDLRKAELEERMIDEYYETHTSE